MRVLQGVKRSTAEWIRDRVGVNNSFDHARAQAYEISHARLTIRRDFPSILAAVDQARRTGSLWQDADNQWFGGDRRLWNDFVEHIRERSCLEIGCGPFGFLAPCYWIKQRTFIDPLLDEYREAHIASAGRTLFDETTRCFSGPAEQKIDALVGKIDGAVICRNAIDHSEDPLTIIHNIAAYAASGCYFLFWCDIWHLDGCDDGHRSITRTPNVFDALLKGYGFRLLRRSTQANDSGSTIEYGALFIKS